MRYFLSAVLFAAGCIAPDAVIATSSAPLFPNSVVSNDLEFIQSDDPSAYGCVAYLGERRQEMPDKRGGDLMANGVFTFDARFTDGASVEIWAHHDLGSSDAAQIYAEKVAAHLGRLPYFMRDPLHHIVLHKGSETAFAEKDAAFMVLYSDNVDSRISTHDLEETLFHESTHAVLQNSLIANGWLQAATKDGAYITRYASTDPDGEDIAESALFAYAMLRHPGRLPADITAKANTIMPNRIALLAPIFTQSDPARNQTPACN
jgi:hypothetical protein